MLKNFLLVILFTSAGFAQVVTSGQGNDKQSKTGNTIIFAVIGDFGQSGKKELGVANLITGWNVDFIVTTGDNNYPDGEATTIDKNIGRYYADYIGNYKGKYGKGSKLNRFFPILGNHDWRADIKPRNKPYLDYFTLPGASSTNTSNTENYYDFIKGDVHFFMLDTGDKDRKSGLGAEQEAWLRSTIPLSKTHWQIVVMHHPPYSSGKVHGPHKRLQLNYEEMGVDAIFNGHEHLYERIHRDDNNDGVILPYFISGTGGKSLYKFKKIPIDWSQTRYKKDYGAILVKVNADSMVFEFWNREGVRIDHYILYHQKTAVFQSMK
jgi:3',5'-cyclic AMP phosphodiesterase CpdA